jgi:hypothetical protein
MTLYPCCVDIHVAALDTAGNNEQSAAWMYAHKFRSSIMVTNNYHMPRSILERSWLIGVGAEVNLFDTFEHVLRRKQA